MLLAAVVVAVALVFAVVAAAAVVVALVFAVIAVVVGVAGDVFVSGVSGNSTGPLAD